MYVDLCNYENSGIADVSYEDSLDDYIDNLNYGTRQYA